MLYRVEFQNFFCFREPQILDLRIGQSVPQTSRFRAIYPGARDRAPLAAVLFGANGSGKSSVLRALAFLPRLFIHSATPGFDFVVVPFRDATPAPRPIRIAYEAGINLNWLQPSETLAPRFGAIRYEITIATDNNIATGIVSERLSQRPHGARRFSTILARDADGVRGSEILRLGKLGPVTREINPKTSVISLLAYLKHEVAQRLIRFVAYSFRFNIDLDMLQIEDQRFIDYASRTPGLVEAVNRELPRLDIGIERMEAHPAHDGEPAAAWFHHYGTAPLPWILQSRGTRSFLKTAPLILEAIENGGIAVIDEIDEALHAHLLAEIFGWFYGERNELDAQILASAQNPALLDELEKEQIVLVEKARDGAASVYRLADVEGVRRSGENFGRKYLEGVYGAVPRIG
jgi:uncharacterized protein